MTSIFDDGNNVRAFLGHIQEISAGSMRELHGVDKTLLNEDERTHAQQSRRDGRETYGSNDIGHMRNSCTTSCTKIKNFRSWWHMDIVYTTENGCAQFRTERIPDTVFNFFLIFTLERASCNDLFRLAKGKAYINADTFFTIDTFADDHVLS